MRIFLKCAIGLIIIFGLFFVRDFRLSFETLGRQHLELHYVVLSLISLTASLGFQLYIWYYLLKKIDKLVNFFDTSIAMLLSFIGNYFSPVSVAAPIKSILLKQKTGIVISESLPLILLELIIGMFCFSIYAFPFQLIALMWDMNVLPLGITARIFAVASISLSALVIFHTISVRKASAFKNLLERFLNNKLLARLKNFYQMAQNSFRQILMGAGFRPIITVLLLSFIWTGLLCYSFYFALKALNIDIGTFTLFSIYSVGFLAGSLSFIPGGLGIRESALIFLLTKCNIPYEAAMPAALLHRILSTIGYFTPGLVGLILWRSKK